MRVDVLVAHQPAYLPWAGYFSRLVDVDRLVLLDHVQFSERGFQNRNYIRSPDGRVVRLTVPIVRRFGQRICDVRLADPAWAARHWRSLVCCYRRSPYWDIYAPRLEAIYKQRFTHLVELNAVVTGFLVSALGLEVELIRSSALQPQGERTAMLVNLAQTLGTDTLRIGTGATSYIDPWALASAGISVEVVTYSPPADIDVPSEHLSVLDLLMRHGPRAREALSAGHRTALGRPLVAGGLR